MSHWFVQCNVNAEGEASSKLNSHFNQIKQVQNACRMPLSYPVTVAIADGSCRLLRHSEKRNQKCMSASLTQGVKGSQSH